MPLTFAAALRLRVVQAHLKKHVFYSMLMQDILTTAQSRLRHAATVDVLSVLVCYSMPRGVYPQRADYTVQYMELEVC